MNFIAEIDIMPHKDLLDPQGRTVAGKMAQIQLGEVRDVRIGKHIVISLEADSEEKAREMIDTACRKLLANLIMETYSFQISPAAVDPEA